MSKSIFQIGDGIAIHYFPYLKAYLGDRAEYSIKGEGIEADLADLRINGGDCTNIFDYMNEIAAKDFRTDYLMLTYGLFDSRLEPDSGKLRVDIDTFRKTSSEIIALAKKMCSRIIWINATPIEDENHNSISTKFHRHNSDIIRFNEISDGMFRDAGAYVIDLYSFTKSLDEDLYCDHAHFNVPVRKLHAAFVAGHLQALLETQKT